MTSSVGKGDEQRAAAALASVLCIQLGPGIESEEVLKTLGPILKKIICDGTASIQARQTCATCFGVCCFIATDDITVSREPFESSYLHISHLRWYSYFLLLCIRSCIQLCSVWKISSPSPISKRKTLMLSVAPLIQHFISARFWHGHYYWPYAQSMKWRKSLRCISINFQVSFLLMMWTWE